MIELTNLGGSPFVLNDNLIETIENIPETKIMLTTGKYILVAEDKHEIIKRVIDYNRQIFQNAVRLTEQPSDDDMDEGESADADQTAGVSEDED